MPDQNGTQNTRMSARMVEEAYITLQEQMQTYRRARNQGNAAAGLDPDVDPVILLQDAVETFFHIVRPYIEGEPRLAEYWHGALAKHPEQHMERTRALQYYHEHSVGVWQSQPHVQSVDRVQPTLTQASQPQALSATDGGKPSPEEWHDMLNLSDTVRVLSAIKEDDGWYYVEGRFAVLGLREVKNWTVRTRTERTQGDGFMAGETTQTEVREPEPAPKVETAAQMLVDVADELDAIASYEPSGDRVHGTPVPDS